MWREDRGDATMQIAGPLLHWFFVDTTSNRASDTAFPFNALTV